MNVLAELGRRVVMLLRRRQFDTDLEEEMRLHFELREQEQIERGLHRRELTMPSKVASATTWF
jgi:hypothetical protein